MGWMGSPLKMLETLIKNIPNFSISISNPNIFSKNKNKRLGLSNAEIEERMGGISVYSISDHSEEFRWCLPYAEGKAVELLFLSKSDADEACTQYLPNKLHGLHLHAIDIALTEIVGWQGTDVPITLVPELSQVKNARQLTGKNVAGVPIFQTDCLKIEYTLNPGKYHLPLFFRKEDLEESLILLKEHRPPSIDIQVSSLEEVIKSMKDCSTSMLNDVVFIGPGQSLQSWGNYVEK